jgi:hypothetical protein
MPERFVGALTLSSPLLELTPSLTLISRDSRSNHVMRQWHVGTMRRTMKETMRECARLGRKCASEKAEEQKRATTAGSKLLVCLEPSEPNELGNRSRNVFGGEVRIVGQQPDDENDAAQEGGLQKDEEQPMGGGERRSGRSGRATRLRVRLNDHTQGYAGNMGSSCVTIAPLSAMKVPPPGAQSATRLIADARQRPTRRERRGRGRRGDREWHRLPRSCKLQAWRCCASRPRAKVGEEARTRQVLPAWHSDTISRAR